MPLVSVTRLRLRSWRFAPAFLWYVMTSSRQAQRAPGFLGGRLMGDARVTFWTVTAWDNESSMRAYRGSGAHKRAMPNLSHWCDEASYTHWTEPSFRLPDVQEAYRAIVAQGRMSRVNHPSPDHLSGRLAQPSARVERYLRPVPAPRQAAA